MQSHLNPNGLSARRAAEYLDCQKVPSPAELLPSRCRSSPSSMSNVSLYLCQDHLTTALRWIQPPSRPSPQTRLQVHWRGYHPRL